MKSYIFGLSLTVLGMGLMLSACNTTKATTDTTVNFFSSTTPNSLFTADGLVKDDQKAKLFAGVAFENLQQDFARGHGEYLASLSTLLNVPVDAQDEFSALIQSKYPVLFTTDLASDRTAHLKMLSALTREWEANSAGINKP
jgi:hypothetical protein